MAYTILIVEYVMIIAMEIAAIIKRMGHAVAETSLTGEKAIGFAELRHPDIVLIDIFLKGMMDGITSAEVIFQNYGIPVINLTANSGTNTLERAMKTKPFGYLTKPVNANELQTAIGGALQKSQQMS